MIITLLSLFVFILVGCQSVNQASDEVHTGHEISIGDLHEITASTNEHPKFLDHYHESIVDIYKEVPHYQDLLEQIPCYCGCGGSVGHRHTYDCFISEHKEDGSVVWDDHGAKCGVCLEIALFSMELHDQGAGFEEIRNFIDERYKEGYAAPTATPSL
ncbi:PCYCGC motif-containing (lipo)protein [Halalkalibacter alkalisediminis]|uniref:PCYCGC motif-containing (Lipo)protein n=2 Tax=Halalkalibacter alkalisediminis TaxID=935616 RepID=A0ABV6NLZ7_9BACI